MKAADIEQILDQLTVNDRGRIRGKNAVIRKLQSLHWQSVELMRVPPEGWMPINAHKPTPGDFVDVITASGGVTRARYDRVGTRCDIWHADTQEFNGEQVIGWRR